MPFSIDQESPVRYVAIGDSFTEGVGDERPDGSPRGWADRVAEGLAVASGQPISYANLAIRGRLLEPIVGDQLEAALALQPKPTLLSLNGGGNDMMRPGTDLDRLIRLSEQAIRRCAEAEVPLLLLSGADPSERLPMGGKIRHRGELLTAALAELVTRSGGVTFVDAFHDTTLRRAEYWSPDRLHLAPAGHARVAALVLSALGRPVPAGNPPSAAANRGLGLEARYYQQHVLPWVVRRLRRRSSGDGREAKHPDWVSIPPAGETAGSG